MDGREEKKEDVVGLSGTDVIRLDEHHVHDEKEEKEKRDCTKRKKERLLAVDGKLISGSRSIFFWQNFFFEVSLSKSVLARAKVACSSGCYYYSVCAEV